MDIHIHVYVDKVVVILMYQQPKTLALLPMMMRIIHMVLSR